MPPIDTFDADGGGFIRPIDDGPIDALRAKQKESIAGMRAMLLSCNEQSGISTRTAINSVLISRVYHQLVRIVRYTEIMDRIEEKLYMAIEMSLDTMDYDDPFTVAKLLKIQSEMQKTMIESQKLLAPYLEQDVFSAVDIVETSSSSMTSDSPYSAVEREQIRNKAKDVLSLVKGTEFK